MLNMRLDRFSADPELRRDLPILQTEGEEGKHFLLSFTQVMRFRL
jgi:hypothetical protein